jgi:DNA topoisomerase-6 subunit B
MASKKDVVSAEVADTRRAPREIAVSEFFAKNRHLLGFDSPQKAVLTAVREAVDNAMDACEEHRILPDISVELTELPEGRFKVYVEDNGPGIPRQEIGKIFAKLLYGSKFHRLKQSRGQQGIGISAAVMYSQMTTGEPAHIVSKQAGARPNAMRVFIDTAKNQPKVESEGAETSDWWKQKESGTSIGLIMTGQYKGGRHGVEAYLKQTALANPHARILFKFHKMATKTQAATSETLNLQRVIRDLPKEPIEIKPHPHGVELGTLQRMLQDAGKQAVGNFLAQSFSRVTSQVVDDVARESGIPSDTPSSKIGRAEAESIHKALLNQKLMAPPTSCLSPIGEEALIKGLYALFGDAKNLGEEDDMEALAPAQPQKGTKAAVAAEPEPVVETRPVASAANKKAAKGAKAAKADDQLDIFAVTPPPDDDNTATTASTPPEPVTVPQPDDDGVAAAAAVARIEQDEDGGAVLAVGENVFVTAVTRAPTVYRGNPFQVECGILYSRDLPGDELARVYRFANRVPLLYQASACAMFKSVVSAPWRSYEVQQSKGALPTGPLVIMVHIASAWVPYTSESKEAIAHYPEVLKEMRLAVMEAGRRLQRFLRRRKRDADEAKARDYITRYLDPIGEALQAILALSDTDRDAAVVDLKVVLERSRSGDKAEGGGPSKGPPKPPAAQAEAPEKVAPKPAAKKAAPKKARKAGAAA